MCLNQYGNFVDIDIALDAQWDKGGRCHPNIAITIFDRRVVNSARVIGFAVPHNRATLLPNTRSKRQLDSLPNSVEPEPL